MEIVSERLNREHGMDLIATAPTVAYEIINTEGKTLRIENPSALPDYSKVKSNTRAYCKSKYFSA